MKKILLIATGGTIASHMGAAGLVPEIAAEGLLKCVPEVFEICQPSAIQIYNIDSTNITPEHWVKLATAIRDHYEEYDGFVVCHGTDTMSYTAAMISYMVQGSPKPIVFTGSQKPIDKEDTDGRINLRDSFCMRRPTTRPTSSSSFRGKSLLVRVPKRYARRVLTPSRAWIFPTSRSFATAK